jgi:uncharacterized UPF0160 family protein
MRVATHDGSFHADDAFAVAALRIAHGNLHVLRTRDPTVLSSCDLRVDVGMRSDPATGDFDHHQQGGAGARPNGIPYASFGLVWQAFGPDCSGGDPAVAARVDRRLVAGIDAHDNGVTLTEPRIDDVLPVSAGEVVWSLNGRWDEDLTPAQEDERFSAAVDLAEGILRREIGWAAAAQQATDLVSAALARRTDPRVVELDRSLPWRETVVEQAPDALLVIYPKTPGWGMQAVPRTLGAFGNRIDLPEAWAGLAGAELAAATGVPDATFCHRGRFYAVADSREGIEALAALTLAQAGEPERRSGL